MDPLRSPAIPLIRMRNVLERIDILAILVFLFIMVDGTQM